MNGSGPYTVRDICRILKITRKTLFYYDHTGLVKPQGRVGPQQAKIYDEAGLCRLRTVLSYKDAGLTLNEIRMILDEEKDRREIISAALARMQREKKELDRKIQNTVELLRKARV